MSQFRFMPGDEIHYLKNNKHHSAKVQRRRLMHESCFNASCCDYETCHGIVAETEAFASKEELLASL